MGSLLHLLFASPQRAAIVVGLAVAIGFGLFSLPAPELVKPASDVTSQSVQVLTGEQGDQLRRAYEAASQGNGEVIEQDKDGFEAQALPYVATFPAEQSGNRFILRHIGQAELGDATVYVWEEELFAAPWWSPHRFVYKALKAETGAFGQVVELTFERDVPGLIGLLLVDAVIGILYGLIVGLIVAVRKVRLEPPFMPERRTNMVTPWSPPTRDLR